ncbi:MAG: alcohol dehydrogenase catalytic domain-containing protein [Defluviitaleaceae bacterium]|nr:alcohol dehydrogenase catalytic domain-containing protein [Defluviitaleaceae bacterium]
MKAIVLHGKDGNYRYEPNWPSPACPDGWAIIKVAYCGVCGSDIPRFASAGSYHHPMILGHEFSGVVCETSTGSLFKMGDAVAVSPIIPCGRCGGCLGMGPFHCESYQFLGSRNDGGFAEYCAVPESNLIKLESTQLLKAGCLVEPMAVGLHTVRRSGFTAGKKAVVFGAGPIGLVIGLWLRRFGAGQVTMVDLRERNNETARAMGFDTVNPTRTDMSSLDKVDYAFEAAGSGKAISDAVAMLKGRGTLTVVGRDTKDTVIPLRSFEALMRGEMSVLGCWGYDIRGEETFVSATLKEYKEHLEALISHTIPVEEAEQVIGDMCARKFEYCKVVISF